MLHFEPEPEYFYTEADVKRIMLSGSLDEFLDLLDFAPEAIIDTIKELSVNLPLNDVAKRDAIKEKFGFDVSRAIEIKNAKYDGGDDAEEFIRQLFELEVIEQTNKSLKTLSVFIVANEENRDLITAKLKCLNYEIIGSCDLDKIFLLEEEVENQVCEADFLLVFSNDFRPDVFYELNSNILKNKKKTIIAYLDGEEGIILPLINIEKYGCYNDFELLRESSFHNLLEYQIMKEEIMKKKQKSANSFESSVLADWAVIVMNSVCRKTFINCFAYSLDFERMHFTKTRLFRFPKCPSCQGDVNLTHPFI